MEITDLRAFIETEFGTPNDYRYLVVRNLSNDNYSDIYGDESVLVQLNKHSVIVPNSRARMIVKYRVIHGLKLVVFQDLVTKEDTYD